MRYSCWAPYPTTSLFDRNWLFAICSMLTLSFSHRRGSSTPPIVGWFRHGLPAESRILFASRRTRWFRRIVCSTINASGYRAHFQRLSKRSEMGCLRKFRPRCCRFAPWKMGIVESNCPGWGRSLWADLCCRSLVNALFLETKSFRKSPWFTPVLGCSWVEDPRHRDSQNISSPTFWSKSESRGSYRQGLGPN